MSTTFVKIHNPISGASTRVRYDSLATWQARGWELVVPPAVPPPTPLDVAVRDLLVPGTATRGELDELLKVGGSNQGVAAFLRNPGPTQDELFDILATRTARGYPNGTAPLDPTARVPEENLPRHLEDPNAWLYYGPPKGGGANVDDWYDMVQLANQAALEGKGVALEAGNYIVLPTSDWPGGIAPTWPDGVALSGYGSARTIFRVRANGFMRFGEITGGQTKSFHLSGFRIHGGNAAVTPWRVGRSVESLFEDIEVAGGAWGSNPAFPEPAVSIDTTQNAMFVKCAFSANFGGGVKYSRGTNNLLFVACIITKNYAYNHWFISVPEETPDVPDQTPANIVLLRCMSEQPVSGVNSVTSAPIPAINILVNSGRLIQFIGSQCSRNNADAPAIHMEQTDVSRPIGAVTWLAGQMRAYGGGAEGARGTIARVLNGNLIVSGGTQFVGANVAFEIGDNGKVILGDHNQSSSVAQLWARHSSATKSIHKLYEMGAGTQDRDMGSPFVIGNGDGLGTTARDLPDMDFYVPAYQKWRFTMYLTVQGADDNTDLALSFGSPTLTTMTWSTLALAENATSATSAGTRARQGANTTLKVGVISANPTRIVIEGEVRAGQNSGDIIPRVAQATAGGNVTISEASLHARRWF